MFGGGAFFCRLNNCTVTGNWANDKGGGAYDSILDNCTLTGNSADTGGGAHSDFGSSRAFNNCIIHYNTGRSAANYYATADSVVRYCCTTPLPTKGFGNITNKPAFVNAAAGDFHLQPNSPCINAGNNAYVTTTIDLDGNPRIVSGTVDIGACEYQGAGSVISYAWLQQFGLPTDGSVDSADLDHDGLTTQQEWQADTIPTNAASCLRLTLISNSPPLAVTFSSSAARLHTLLCCTNLTAFPASSIWTPVPGQTDVPGNGDVLTLTDTNPPAPGFYRVLVKFP
jgi:hypothetical protein